MPAPSSRRSGAWGDTAGVISIDGGDVTEMASALADVSKRWRAEQRKANWEVARKTSEWVRAAARSGTKREARFASALRPVATDRYARIRIHTGGDLAGAASTYWGARKRSGWYARYRYRDAPGSQHPRWVGASWTPGVRGEGPYVVNDEVADRFDEIQDLYADAYERAFSRAFPGGFE